MTFRGTYSVKPSCTGNLTINAGANGIIHRDLVVVDGGREVEFVSTDPGLVIAGSMKKQRTEEEEIHRASVFQFPPPIACPKHMISPEVHAVPQSLFILLESAILPARCVLTESASQ